MSDMEHRPEDTGSLPGSEGIGNIADMNPEDAFLAAYSQMNNPKTEPEAHDESPAADEDAQEAELVSEDSTEAETAEVEGADDAENDPVEADEGVFEEDEDSTELEMFDYDDIKTGLIPIKMDGEVKGMTLSQIQAALGRSAAADRKSREASQQLAELEEAKKAHEAKVAEFQAKQDNHVQSDQLVDLQARVRGKMAEYETAKANRDWDAVTDLKGELIALNDDVEKVQHEINAHTSEVNAKRTAEAKAAVSDAGYKIFTDEAAGTLWKNYALANLSDEGKAATAFDPSVVIMVEKARLWDESQKKSRAPRKVKKAAKTLKAGGTESPQSVEAKKQAELLAKGKAGKLDSKTAEDLFMQQMAAKYNKS